MKDYKVSLPDVPTVLFSSQIMIKNLSDGSILKDVL